MKKENIQSRNRKLSAKSRKKHNSFTAEMLKPFEKMYSYGMAGAGMAGHMSSAAMTGSMGSSYYMPPPHQGASSSASMHAQFGASAASMHPMANPFGTSSFGGMVSKQFFLTRVRCCPALYAEGAVLLRATTGPLYKRFDESLHFVRKVYNNP